MKNLILVLSITLFLTCLSAGVIAGEPKGKDGMYWLKYGASIGWLTYEVDTICQQCYVITTDYNSYSIAVIPCENLAKRPEWKPIITWVEDKEATAQTEQK